VTAAETFTGRFGELCCKRVHGRGLLLLDLSAEAGAFITWYSGEPLNQQTLSATTQRPRSHMVCRKQGHYLSNYMYGNTAQSTGLAQVTRKAAGDG